MNGDGENWTDSRDVAVLKFLNDDKLDIGDKKEKVKDDSQIYDQRNSVDDRFRGGG